MKKSFSEIKGFFERNLQLIIQFHREYAGLFEDPQLAVAEIAQISTAGNILPQAVAKFETKDLTQSAQGSGETQIGQQAVAQLFWVRNVIGFDDHLRD